ncbi:MAG: Cdc6/Cdc18 family protein [Thermoplasmatota archaeon]
MPPSARALRPVIKDDAVFSFNYVPPSLPHRERQLAQLRSLFEPVLRSGVSQTAFITGHVGTGKTALAKTFCRVVEADAAGAGRAVVAELVNCRNRDSPPEILHRIITARFQEHLQERGFSAPQLLNILRGKLAKGRTHLVVALDEVNALIKRAGPDLIYNLTRFDEDTGGAQGSVSLILISQLTPWELLHDDPAIASAFKQSNTIVLPPYTAEELENIARARADLGLHPGTWSPEVIKLVARLAASEGGDARRAIEVLEAAARRAEGEGLDEITPAIVEEAAAAQYGGLPLERLDGLERAALLVALGIARASRKKAFVTTGEAERAYRVVCEERRVAPLGHTQLWKYIQLLESHGVIDTAVEKEGGAGTTTRILLHDATGEGLERMVLFYLDGRRFPGRKR